MNIGGSKKCIVVKLPNGKMVIKAVRVLDWNSRKSHGQVFRGVKGLSSILERRSTT